MREARREFKPIVIIECSSGVLGSSRLTKLPTQNLSEIPKRFMILLLWSWETNMDDGLLLLLIHSAVTVRIWGQISGITLKMKHLFNLHGCTETLTDWPSDWQQKVKPVFCYSLFPSNVYFYLCAHQCMSVFVTDFQHIIGWIVSPKLILDRY